jgi:hypothetical protein
MSDLFYDVASIDYPIIDADAHVNEPPDLWQSRVPARLKHKAPKVPTPIRATSGASTTARSCAPRPHRHGRAELPPVPRVGPPLRRDPAGELRHASASPTSTPTASGAR